MMMYLLAVLIGLLLGVLANRFIYDWAWFAEFSLSPWGRRPAIYSVSTSNRIPLVGWFAVGNLSGKTLYPKELELASEEEKHLIPKLHSFSWLRPFCVELFCAAGLPALLWWYLSGGLVGSQQALELIPGGSTTLWVQVALHAAILWLMLIAALIDWDERTIPDQTTVPGLLLGIVTLTIFPAARLPEVSFEGLKTVAITPLHVLSPDPFPQWLMAPATLGAVVGCWLFWGCLVVPKTVDWRYGPTKALRYMFASVIRPARKNATIGSSKRSKPITTWITLLVAVVGIGCSLAAWYAGGTYWESHSTMVLSMALAGLGTWLVRLLASMTVGDEALGFGDVTLMFMIGAVFGWQLALLTFVLGPILSLGFAVGNLLLTGEQKLAFGPWLCLGATLCLIYWSTVWSQSASGFFGIGVVTLLAIIAVCLAMLPPLLWLLIKLKEMAGLA